MKNPSMHVSLYSANIDNTVAFYTKFFGQGPAKVKSGYVKFELEEPSLVISFAENADRVSPNFGHLGIRIDSAEELQSRMEAIQALGLETREEMGTNCCYARQDKFWVKDPDGHPWEVYQLHEDVEYNDPHYADENAPEAEACCSPAMVTEPKQKIQLAEITADGPSCAPGSGCC
ncbi:VOC family protein [bacterium SCSIO 12741]|nr:VOC family protein [bacterium SCSIO 12741]